MTRAHANRNHRLDIRSTATACAAILLIAACGRGSDGDRSSKSSGEPGATQPAAPAEPTEIPADYPGLAITAKEARFAGEAVAPSAGLVGDRAALVARLRAARETLANDNPHATNYILAVVVAPDAPGDAALVSLRAAFEAGFTQLFVMDRPSDNPLDAVCGPVFTNPPEEATVVLSVLVEAGKVWTGLSRLNDFRVHPPGGSAVLGETIAEFGESSYFVDRKDAEIAVAPGIPARVLLAVMATVCERFSRLRPLAPDELRAKPMQP